MQEMKIRCHSQDHADRVVVAARGMGCSITADYSQVRGWDTLQLHDNGIGSFWGFDYMEYPEYRLYGDHLLPVSEGWIAWGGGECPVADDDRIDCMLKNGNQSGLVMAGSLRWSHGVGAGDIIAYRLADRQHPAEDKAELTPCQKRGLRVGQWVWFAANIVPRWVQLRRDDGEGVPHFNCDDSTIGLSLGYIDFTQGIHDSKPDWTPQPTIPDEQIAQAADTPVEWDGSGAPVVGERVVISSHATGGKEVSGVIVLPPDSDGDYVIKSDNGVYWTECANSLLPIQPGREKAVAELAKFLSKYSDTSHRMRAEMLYDAGYRKTENNHE